MNDEQKLTIAISAVDNASAVLKELAGNVNQATGQITQSTEKAGTSFGTLVGSIFTAQVAYQGLSGVIQDVKGFIESSIAAALDASQTMVQVQVDVANAGLSYSKLAPQIDAVAKNNERLGFTQEETQLSLGKAILATGNYSDALKLNHLAMDLSVAKHMDLDQATTLLQQVMAGNTRVLKSYGIVLDSSATSADALNTVQEKVGGSAEALAGTPAGSLREIKAQWQGIEVEVGEKLMPVLVKLFADFEKNLPQIEHDVLSIASTTVVWGEKAFDVFGLIGDGLGSVMHLLQGLANASSDSFVAVIDGAKAAGDALKGNFSDAKNEIQQAGTMGKNVGIDISTAFDKIGKNADDAGQKWTALTSSEKANADQTKALTDVTKSAAVNFDDFENRIQKADNAAIKHSDAIVKLTDDYTKMKDEGAKDLAELSDAFTTKMQTINDAIAKTQKSITDLTTSYTQSQKDEVTKVAEDIVGSEQKIADLKKQISEATSTQQQQTLQEQLNAEQQNYDSSLTFRQAHTDAITAAEARAKETDLQRTIDDYSAKKTLDDTAYQEKLTNLQKELADKQKEATDETNLYQSKVAQINKILDAGNAYFLKLSNERVAVTTKEVQAEIAQFQALTAAINASKSASSSALGTISVPTLQGGIAQHESGGFVNAPRGTAVPIIAHGGEEVIPAEQVGSRSGGSITIVIQNPIVRRDSDLDDMREQVEEVFRSILINHKIVHI